MSKNDLPPLTPERFDAAIRAGSKPEKLWGAQVIAEALGVSEKTVRRWATDAAVPIYHPPGSGSLFALRSELAEWLRKKAA